MDKNGTIPTSSKPRASAAEHLRIGVAPPLTALNAGLFISRGRGMHPDRTIDSHELLFVKRGRLGMAERERRFALEAGQTLLLWPGRRHYGTETYPPDLSFYWLHFRLPRAPGSNHDPRQAFSIPQVGRPARPDRLTELFHQFLDDQESGALQPLQAAWLIRLMLSEAARRTSVAAPDAPSAAVLAERVDAYLIVHVHEPVSTSTIAAALRCNPDYLGRVYRKARGYTLTDGLHRRRVREARGLLIDGRLNVDEIARECGFEDAGYFRRIFKRQVGVTPLAFRRLHARAHVNSR
ncbi:MAG: AraC family transcriptional regulator [Planctomycetes bacterium]|nr:AraC family transcriptional regulator [Planctomycetota bacterium]